MAWGYMAQNYTFIASTTTTRPPTTELTREDKLSAVGGASEVGSAGVRIRAAHEGGLRTVFDLLMHT